MSCCSLFLIFLLLNGIKGFTKDKQQLIDKLIRNYSIKNVFIVSEEKENLGKYLTSFFRNEKSLTLNIHTKDFENVPEFTNIESKLLFITANNSNSLRNVLKWNKVYLHSQATLVIVALSTKLKMFNMPQFLAYSQVLIMTRDANYKCNYIIEYFCEPFNTVKEFIDTNIYENPVEYWPELISNHRQQYSIGNFPMIISSSTLNTPKSGLIFYYTSTFYKYYENFRNQNIRKNKQKSKYTRVIDIMSEVVKQSTGYPLKMTKVCFMLPIIDEFSQQDFLKKPFKSWVWILILIELFYFTVLLRLVLVPDLFLCFYESLACTLGSVHKGINNKIIYIQMFLYGFIIWNLYSAKLSSYLTTPNLGRVLKTTDDINKANITLWADFNLKIRGNLTVYMKDFHSHLYDFKENIFKEKFNYNIPAPDFYEKIYKFDVSRGYLINDIKWSFIRRSQMLLKRKLFSFSNVCSDFGYIYPFYFYDISNILQDIFSSYTLKVTESGLDLAWEEKSYYDIKFKFRTDFDEIPWQVLELQFFEVIFWIFFTGISLSILVFIAEMVKRRSCFSKMK